MMPSNTFDKICCIQMSQYYRQSGILPPVSCEIRVILFLLFHAAAALFSRQLQPQDFSFFVWSSTKGSGLLARRSHSSAACMYRQVRRMTGALVGQKMQFGEISEKVGGNERQGEGRSGGGGQCLEGIQGTSNSQSGWFKSKWVLIGEKKILFVEAEASFETMIVWWCCEIDSP